MKRLIGLILISAVFILSFTPDTADARRRYRQHSSIYNKYYHRNSAISGLRSPYVRTRRPLNVPVTRRSYRPTGRIIYMGPTPTVFYNPWSTMILISLLSIIFIAVIAYAFGHFISKPIVDLHHGAEIIESGNLDFKVGTQKKDEIGQLSRAFDKMTSNLKDMYDKLENRVEERTAQLMKSNAQLKNITEELDTANKELAKLATTDGLTGIKNRYAFNINLVNEWKHCYRKKEQLSIIMFDIDFFKLYNDHYGHVQGDECLKKIGAFLKSLSITQRPGDMIARYGGEEFIILLSNASNEYTLTTAQQILDGITQLGLKHEYSKVKDIDHVTVSIGVATDKARNTPDELHLVNEADKNLYQAKSNGRNQIYSNIESP